MTTKTRSVDRVPRLVDVAWLASHLEGPSFRLVDVRAELPDFEIGYRWGHIPGAVHLDMRDLFTELDGVPGRLVGQSTAERVLGGLGLSMQTPVVVYDESFGPLAAQLAWLLAYYGQPNVRVLAGGWEAWEATGGPVSTQPMAPEPGLYVAEPDGTAVATAHWVAAHLEHPGLVLLDARTEAEYARGHLPGALNLPYEESLCYNPTPGLRPPDELRRRFAEMGVTPEREVVVYCETGARSAHTWLVLRHLGYPRVRNYEGSWAEWSRRPELPVVGEREPASTGTPAAGKQPAAPIGPCGLPLVAPARVTPTSGAGQLGRRSRDQVVAEARGQITETDVASLRARLDADEPMVVVDIRWNRKCCW